jgi:NDP-sugar pyrophosphorylase family protein
MENPRPKPLVEVHGEPLIALNAKRLIKCGIAELHVALHHRPDEVRAGLIPYLPQSLPVTWIVESKPLGTIGSISQLRAAGKTVISMNADLYTELELLELLAQHRTSGADITIATHESRLKLNLGEVICSADNRVTAYLEKPEKRFRIASGINVLEPKAVTLVVPDERLDFPELAMRALNSGLRVHAFAHETPWIDVNDLSALRAAERRERNQSGVFDAPVVPGGDFEPSE